MDDLKSCYSIVDLNRPVEIIAASGEIIQKNVSKHVYQRFPGLCTKLHYIADKPSR